MVARNGFNAIRHQELNALIRAAGAIDDVTGTDNGLDACLMKKNKRLLEPRVLAMNVPD